MQPWGSATPSENMFDFVPRIETAHTLVMTNLFNDPGTPYSCSALHSVAQGVRGSSVFHSQDLICTFNKRTSFPAPWNVFSCGKHNTLSLSTTLWYL